MISLKRLLCDTALYRFRSCLEDPQFLRFAIEAPLNVHRAAIVLFYSDRLLCQFFDLRIRQRKVLSFGCGCFDDPCGFGCGVVRIDHLAGFAANFTAKDSWSLGTQCGFVHIELIRVHSALHDGLAKPP